MPSLMSRLVVPAYLRAARANRAYRCADEARKRVAQRSLRPQPYGPPARLRRDVTITPARRTGWPVYTIAPMGVEPRGALVYVHGGAWVSEINPQHWHLAAGLAVRAQLTVVLPIYPLAPFATAAPVVDGVVELIEAARERYGATVLAGDSAGGQIALSAAMQRRDRHAPPLPRTVLISPALDLTFSNPQMEAIQRNDPWLGKNGGDVFAELWRGELALTDPRVSPLFGDVAGLGPLSVYSGTHDVLNADAQLLVEKAMHAGVLIRYVEQPGLLHVYPLTPTPEGRAARREIADELRRSLDDALTPAPRPPSPAYAT